MMNNNNHLVNLNPHLKKYDEDTLFHIGFSSAQDNLPEMFGDVKFVCMGGTAGRMRKYSEAFSRELEVEWTDYTKGERYGIFKAGPILCISHGIGKPSASIVLHEVIKLVNYAGCQDVVFIRMGTCGGINCEAGTVVVTNKALDEMLKPEYNLHVLGKLITRPTQLSQELAEDIISCKPSSNNFDIIRGNTLCTSDFFEGQARLDGAFCHYEEEDKMEYLKKVRDAGVRNIEMESAVVAGLCNAAQIKAAVVCVTLLDRLKTDQITLTHDQLSKYEKRPMDVILAYVSKKLGKGRKL
ncbi:uridine phosphorylase 2 [Strongylocentrotus purpuratus]|uniref:Nucleoside phosphorylase domain-containing protein n=1 Tax=Strongylocentrotus purpuratus TaxID=7668 RepID=A0A7M7RG84_STRPU|nr:uridine phosphorylase 2 [Strongylocentrotus purpuratus]|eukprot:XP_788853.2 PREDICTED: uridine phosphorylase 2 isoform X1 [Strongylocentrotus purpuratus]